MTLGFPVWAAIAVVLALAVPLLCAWGHRRRAADLARAFPSPWLARLTASVSPGRRRLGSALVTAALALLALALAQPRWGRSSVQVERSGIDLVIALDVSRSMLAPDAGQTNRLAAARAAIEALLDTLGGDRVGLLIFAGEAYLASPLTRDHSAVRRALESIDTSSVSEPGSDLAKAITLAREGFQRGAGDGPRALLIVSDGEQVRGDAIGAARTANAAGISVHTAGVGSTAGARIPARTGMGPQAQTRNAFGREVITRVDEAMLQRMATAGGGTSTRLADADDQALVRWFASIAARLPLTTERRDLSEPREQFQWPLAAALVCLALRATLGERRRSNPPLPRLHPPRP